MKTIGEFAKEHNVTIRALHHYEKLGLITPYKVDEFTGYRYYKIEQGETLNIIVVLKNLGFSLSGIKRLLGNIEDKDLILQSLESKRTQAMIQKDASQRNYRLLTSILQQFKTNENTAFKEIVKMSIQTNENPKDMLNMFRHLVDVTFYDYKECGKDLFAMSIDIDCFGKINTDYGYTVGDEVISRISSAILKAQDVHNKQNIQHYTLVEHTGGDEFKVIIKDSKARTEELAKAIVGDVKALDFSDTADDLHASVTIGISSINDAPSTFKFLHYADTALLDAKQKNKGSYLFYTNE